MPRKLIWVVLLLLLVPGVFAKSLEKKPVSSQPVAKISIVIDDLGDNSIIARQMLSLPGQMTAAILPHTPFATFIAEYAESQGHEVIMHLPMEAFSRPDLLGPGALYANMAKTEIEETLVKNAASVPYMVGFNNHMGSMLTESHEKMRWVMESAKRNGWYFLDSKTSESSVAQSIASQVGLPAIGRDIFLDHHLETQRGELSALFQQRFQRAMRIAKKTGRVVIICHPYPETLEFLKRQIPSLSQEFQLVHLSKLLPPKIDSLVGEEASVSAAGL